MTRHHPSILSEQAIAQYNEDGFTVVKGLLVPEELEPLQRACVEDPDFNGLTVPYGTSGEPTPELAWWALGNTYLGTLPRLQRLVLAVETLLGDECYHWHSLLVQKRPRQQSTFSWHSAYGTFYHDGVLFPDMVICIVAVNPTTVQNGCLKMLPGSHRMGRVDHQVVGGEYCVEPERLPAILERLQPVDVEMDAGDALFFHSNTLHASGPNNTDEMRAVLVLRYNAASNVPYPIPGNEHRKYRRLNRAPDNALRDSLYQGLFEPDQIHSPELGQGKGLNIVQRFPGD